MDRSMEGEDEGGSEIIKRSEEQEGGGRGVIRSYECTFCKRGFSNAQALGGHMNIHRKDKAKLKQSSNQLPHHHNRDETTSSLSLHAVHIRKLPLFAETPNCGEEGDQIHEGDGEKEKEKEKCTVASAGQGSSSDLDLELRLGPNPPSSSPTRKFF